ncbi:hypothetical protein BJY16_006423 [Actinoplanes octamycinicus]|uniref:Uncharacterized protein n=1 Tax=Actinoplanes octamycinicus TaxID=135948 RepID=A0A7W7H369_9ACTN|nr:hypothetical protein [Actinoplanes octamycinicus]MBB4742964.1 hypothetical protein [Actinoplanes octamycinicus]GIE58183.1 hypothetical protein Aoc01nite_35850 [Actinoplanes octamycinicus]
MTSTFHRTLSALVVTGALVLTSGGVAAAALSAKPLRAEVAPTEVLAKPLRAE